MLHEEELVKQGSKNTTINKLIKPVDYTLKIIALLVAFYAVFAIGGVVLSGVVVLLSVLVFLGVKFWMHENNSEFKTYLDNSN